MIDPSALLPLLLFTLVAYVYVAACLSIIASKSGHPRPWLAWIPFANLFLMCAVSRKPAWWALLMLVPFVNLVVFAIVWGGIAQARGKPAWLGFLMLIPIVNLAIPAYLAMGSATAHGLGAASDDTPAPAEAAPYPSKPAAAESPSPPPAAASDPRRFMGPRVCPTCGAEVDADDTFCGVCGASVAAPTEAGGASVAAPNEAGNAPSCRLCGAQATAGDVFCDSCGAPLAADHASPMPTRQPAPDAAPVRAAAPVHATAPPHAPPAKGKGAPIALIAGATALVVILAAVLWIFFGAGSYTPPPRTRPSIPPSISGTLFELPVDGDRTAPARPTQFAAMRLDRGEIVLGIEVNTLVPGARAVSAASYKTEALGPTVHVAVIDAPPRTNVEAAAERIQRATGGNVSAIRAQRGNATYPGYSIRTTEVLVHVLTNPARNCVIVVWASDPSAFSIAGRLAANVGSGVRLLGESVVRSTFGALPASPPRNLAMTEIRNLTPREPEALLSGLNGFVSASSPELARVMANVARESPRNLTTARFRDRSGYGWNAAIAYYGTSNRARMIWWKTRFAAGSAMRLVNVSGVECLYRDGASGRLLMFRKGPFLGVVESPPGASAGQLRQFMEAMQL